MIDAVPLAVVGGRWASTPCFYPVLLLQPAVAQLELGLDFVVQPGRQVNGHRTRRTRLACGITFSDARRRELGESAGARRLPLRSGRTMDLHGLLQNLAWRLCSGPRDGCACQLLRRPWTARRSG